MKSMRFSLLAAAFIVALGSFGVQPARAEIINSAAGITQSVDGAQVIQTSGRNRHGFHFGSGRNHGYGYGYGYRSNRHGYRNHGYHGSRRHNRNRRHGFGRHGFGFSFGFGHRRH